MQKLDQKTVAEVIEALRSPGSSVSESFQEYVADVIERLSSEHSVLTEEVERLKAAPPSGLCSEAAPCVEYADLLASNERMRKALEEGANYLDSLGDNLLRNDADMQLDDCEDPKDVAERLRQGLGGGDQGAADPVQGEDAANHDCLAKRRTGEPMFILLGRDPDAHYIVKTWAERRLAAGGDPAHCQMGLDTAVRMRVYAADPANAPASAPPAEAYPTFEPKAGDQGAAQQGEEFLEFKEALSDIRALRQEFHDLSGGGPRWAERNKEAWAKADELFANEDEAAWDRQQEDRG